MPEEKRIPVQVRIPETAHTALKIEAAAQRISLHDKILQYLFKGLSEKRSRISKPNISKSVKSYVK